MSGGLVHRESGGVARVRHEADPGKGMEVGELSFTAPGMDYETDMPTFFRKGASNSMAVELRKKTGPSGGGALELFNPENTVKPMTDAELARFERQVVASGVRQLKSPRRSNGRIVLRRIGWKATPDRIMVTTAEQELEKVGEKQYRPSGPWLIEHRMTYRCTHGASERRRGTVAMDAKDASAGNDESPTDPSNQKQSLADQIAQDFPEGAMALAVLPETVRASVVARVPYPKLFDGVVLAYTRGDTPPGQSPEVHRQEVNLLRMDARRAVVVQATTKPGTTKWEVSQAVYQLGEPEVEQA